MPFCRVSNLDRTAVKRPMKYCKSGNFFRPLLKFVIDGIRLDATQGRPAIPFSRADSITLSSQACQVAKDYLFVFGPTLIDCQWLICRAAWFAYAAGVHSSEFAARRGVPQVSSFAHAVERLFFVPFHSFARQ